MRESDGDVSVHNASHNVMLIVHDLIVMVQCNAFSLIQSSSEPSAFQQALAKKQAQNRVAQKAKKMYAMMEEETVIGDPGLPRVGQLSRNQLPGGVADEERETQAEPTGEVLMDEQRPGLEWAYAPTDIPLG